VVKTNGSTPLNEFPDNTEPAFEVPEHGVHDITAPVPGGRAVSKREVRQMFIKFMQTSPELMKVPREQQIREFNSCRSGARCPKVDPIILADLLVPESGSCQAGQSSEIGRGRKHIL
jgi:hypothetical protein